MRAVRTEYQISRRLLADYLSISSNQLIRIERSVVSLRLGVAWDFCELTKTNPFWLAFGEPHHRLAFGSLPSTIPPGDRSILFVPRMRQLLAGGRLTVSRAKRQDVDQAQLKIKMLAGIGVKRYLSHMPATPILTWTGLRSRLTDATSAAGAKAALARELGVTRQAVSQWLSGDSSPTASTTLRLLEWVEQEESQKNRGDRVGARPPHKPKERQISDDEKRNSGSREK